MQEDSQNHLDKANELRNDIQELEKFIYTVTEFDKESSAIPAVNVLFRKKVEVTCSLFGSRYFGCGTHFQEILIPNELRNQIIELAKNRKAELEDEFKNCFTSSSSGA